MADLNTHWHTDIGDNYRNHKTTRTMPFWADYNFPLLTFTYKNGQEKMLFYPGAKTVEIYSCDSSECQVED